MNYIFDDNLNEIFNLVISDIKKININTNLNRSDILLLVLIKKEDSLLNCLCKLKYNEIIKLINNTDCIDCYDEVLKFALSIAIKDSDGIISDEHLLYAITCSKESLAYKILDVNVDINKMKETIIDYLEIDNDDYLVNLTLKAKENRFFPYIGRKEYINKMIRIIEKKQKNNCMLIGSAGVGKTALLEGFVMELLKRDSIYTVYRLDIGTIIAGTRYRGDLEERLIAVIDKIKNSNNILFIDEIHMVMGSAKSEDTITISNILKPILSRDEIKCIGATTIDEYYEYIEKDHAFARRFQNIFVPEASIEETNRILLKIKNKYENYHNIKYNKDIIKEIINNCSYFPNRRFPDKAIDLMDELGVYVKNKQTKKVTTNDIKRIVFENIGVKNKKNAKINHTELLPFYNMFYLGLSHRKTICNILNEGANDIINDFKQLFVINDEQIIIIDLILFDDNMYNYLVNSILKYPICIVLIKGYKETSNIIKTKIDKIIDSGRLIDEKGRIILLKNTIIIINESIKTQSIGYNSLIQDLKLDYIDVIIKNEKKESNDIITLINELKNNKINIEIDKTFNLEKDKDYLLKQIYKIIKKKENGTFYIKSNTYNINN